MERKHKVKIVALMKSCGWHLSYMCLHFIMAIPLNTGFPHVLEKFWAAFHYLKTPGKSVEKLNVSHYCVFMMRICGKKRPRLFKKKTSIFVIISYINWHSYVLYLNNNCFLTSILICVCCSSAWYRWASSGLFSPWTVKMSCCSSFSGMFAHLSMSLLPSYILPKHSVYHFCSRPRDGRSWSIN